MCCPHAPLTAPIPILQVSTEQALATAYRMVKEGGVDVIKLEGGVKRAATVRQIVVGQNGRVVCVCRQKLKNSAVTAGWWGGCHGACWPDAPAHFGGMYLGVSSPAFEHSHCNVSAWRFQSSRPHCWYSSSGRGLRAHQPNINFKHCSQGESCAGRCPGPARRRGLRCGVCPPVACIFF